jgi:guanylate kinase
MSEVYIISAPSGSGKSTLVSELRKTVPRLEFSISYTTRKPRGSEQNGREYYFVSREEFERMIASGEFLEHADVFGNYYGTAKRFLREAEAHANDLLLDIDVQGERLIKAKLPRACSIFVLPPSKKELEMRLRRRSQAEHVQSPEVIERRLHDASREIENYPNYEYILVNDRLEDSIDQLKAIVLWERGKRSGQMSPQELEQHRELAEPCLQANARERLRPILESFALAGSRR